MSSKQKVPSKGLKTSNHALTATPAKTQPASFKPSPLSATTGKKRKVVSTKQDSDAITTPTPAKRVKSTEAQPKPTPTSKPTRSNKPSVTSTPSPAASKSKPTPAKSTTPSQKSKPASASKKAAPSKATPTPPSKNASKAKATNTPAPKSKAPSKPVPSHDSDDDDDEQDILDAGSDSDIDMDTAPVVSSKKSQPTKNSLKATTSTPTSQKKQPDTRTLQDKIHQRASQMDEDDDDDSDESDDYSDLDMHSDGEFPLDTDQLRVLDQMEQKINANLAKSKVVVAPKKPSAKNAPGPDENRGVIYLGHIPFGFFEDQMRGFFSQFGNVTRLRLARNKKTGRSKHYAFIEFESDEVADIVASSMNNYMMYGHTLVCERIPSEHVHPNTFDGADRKYHVIPWQRIARQQHNQDKTPKQHQKRVKRLLKKESRKHAELQSLNIDYHFNGYKEQLPAKATRKKLV